jgi:hypothetical protein
VVTVVVMAAIGLLDPIAGLLGLSMCSSAARWAEMQQDTPPAPARHQPTKQFRSGGWHPDGRGVTAFHGQALHGGLPGAQGRHLSHPEQKVAQWQMMTY